MKVVFYFLKLMRKESSEVARTCYKQEFLLTIGHLEAI
jgi:hypothetical protein